MTADEILQFAQAFNRLAVASRLPAEQMDESIQQIYWDGLEDLPVEAVVQAASHLERTAKWFPRVAEWREVAKPLAVAVRVKLLAQNTRDEPWHHECQACEDTGWRILRCFPEVSAPCGVLKCKKTREHTYAVRCDCIDTNRTYQRHREYQFKGAQG